MRLDPPAGCAPEAWAELRRLYQQPERRAFSACYRTLYRQAVEQGWALPSERTLYRYTTDRPADVLALHRDGAAVPDATLETRRLGDLLDLVARAFGADAAALRGGHLPKRLAPARHAFCLLAARLTANSYRVIAEAIGRDHSTVMAAEITARQREDSSAAYAETLAEISATWGRRA